MSVAYIALFIIVVGMVITMVKPEAPVGFIGFAIIIVG